MRDSGVGRTVFEMPPAGSCQSYRPGHATHWIMANLYRSHPAIPAVVRDLRATAITLQLAGSTVVWHHHEPARVLDAMMLSTAVAVIEPCTAIVVGRSSRHWFYCSTDELTPCKYPQR